MRGTPSTRASMFTAKVVCSERVLVELVEHDVGVGVALELDHQPGLASRRVVLDVGDAVELARS